MKTATLLLLIVVIVQAAEPARYHFGDNPRWADPHFDDSQWPTISGDLLPTPPFYSNGFLWIRERVPIPVLDAPLGLVASTPSAPLPTVPISNVPGPLEVWINGDKLGSVGTMPPRAAGPVYAAAVIFRLRLDLSTPGTTVLVARRVWTTPIGRIYPPITSHPQIGLWDTLQLDVLRGTAAAFQRDAPNFLLQAMGVLFGIVLILTFILVRGFRSPLWFGLSSIGHVSILVAYFALVLWPRSPAWFTFTLTHAIDALSSMAFFGFIWSIFSIRRKLLFVLLLVAEIVVRSWYVYAFVTVHPSGLVTRMMTALQVYLLSSALVIAVLCIGQAARHRSDKVLLAIALATTLYWFMVAGTNAQWIGNYIDVGPVRLSSRELSRCFLAIALTWLLLRRVWKYWRSQQELDAELEAAREVQTALVRRTPDLCCFHIESAYYPSRRVGGDFYRIFPLEGGAVFLVVGDASGKGLRAAMTATGVIGGAEAIQTRQPGKFLRELNGVAKAQPHSEFVTCCAARISPSGQAIIASAGHLPPYLNGAEVEVAASLPLGIEDAEYEETRLEIPPGATLTFVSDGVPEARSRQGELFGFDRTRQVIQQAAEVIAKAAQAFGQEDDITVVSVRFKAAQS